MKSLWIATFLLVAASGLAAQDQPVQPPPDLTLEKPQAKPEQEPPDAPAPGLTLERPIAKPEEKKPGKASEKKRVVEEIVARVNNEIITLSDMGRARASVSDEVRQDCQNCTPAQIEVAIKDKQQNLLRDLIDQSLLVQKGKDLNLNVEPDVVKQMDRVRQQNKLKDMDELDNKLRESGIVPEDYKSQIRNQILTQDVIRHEVGSRIVTGRDDIKKYYELHQKEFVRPESVFLSEFFLSTEKKSEEEIPKIEVKAKAYLDRIKKGEDFEELAKRYSEGTTAKEGGSLGSFQRGQLSKEIEDQVFKLKRNEMTDVIRTKTGFLILKVDQSFEAGQQPLEKVEPEIQNRLYYEKMQPQLRLYLAHLREESYVVVKPGYVDSAAVASTPIIEAEPSAETGKGGKKDKKDRKSKTKGAPVVASKKDAE